MFNKDLKDYAKKNNVYLYEVADALGVVDSTLSKHLRKEWSEEKKKEFYEAVDKIAESRK